MKKTIFTLAILFFTACSVDVPIDVAPDATVSVDADNNVSQVCRNIQSGTDTDGYLFHQGACLDELDGTECSDAVRVPAGSVGCCDTLNHWHPCTMEPTH